METVRKDETLCQAVVSVRDTYRSTGRGKGGFELHYLRRACQRRVKPGERYCWQHRLTHE